MRICSVTVSSSLLFFAFSFFSFVYGKLPIVGSFILLLFHRLSQRGYRPNEMAWSCHFEYTKDIRFGDFIGLRLLMLARVDYHFTPMLRGLAAVIFPVC